MIYQGVNCTWIGERNTEQTLACPFCAGALREVPTFWADVDGVERGEYTWPSYKKTSAPPDWQPRPHPGYRSLWEYAIAQNRCFKHIAHLRNSFKVHAGILVEIEP
jgi:hypothetical protein